MGVNTCSWWRCLLRSRPPPFALSTERGPDRKGNVLAAQPGRRRQLALAVGLGAGVLFVPLLLLERAPEPATPGAGAAMAPAVAAAQADVVTDERASAPPAGRVTEEDAERGDGLQATDAVAPGDPAAVEAAPPPPPVVESTTTTTTVPEVTTTTTTALLPLAKVLPSVRTRHQSGQASWYHWTDASCAHRTLPFGTIVTVIRVDTGARTTCRVNDRGPVPPERVIDLSHDTFARLGDPDAGLIEVRLQW